MKGLAVILVAAATLAGCAATPGTRERSELVVEPDACAPKRFDIYFADGEAGLTEAARTAIGLNATQLQGCRIRNVNVIGLTDSRGGPTANLDLSERRARAVTEALEAAGWPAPVFNLIVAGESGSTTPSGVSEPMRRRTEVLVDAGPR